MPAFSFVWKCYFQASLVIKRYTQNIFILTFLNFFLLYYSMNLNQVRAMQSDVRKCFVPREHFSAKRYALNKVFFFFFQMISMRSAREKETRFIFKKITKVNIKLTWSYTAGCRWSNFMMKRRNISFYLLEWIWSTGLINFYYVT